MKRSKAFILAEILTGMVLQAGFIIVLCTSFYLMLSFYTRTQQTLSARQKGEKVIAYVDARIKNAGLGLGKCSNSGEIREALSKVTSLLDNRKLTLPVSVTSGNWKFKSKNSDKKFTGNRLTLLYTQRASDLQLIIRTIESPDKSGCNCSVDIKAATRELALIAKKNSDGKYTFASSKFLTKSYETSLKSYTVIAGTGAPLYLNKSDNAGTFKLEDKTSRSSTYVYPGDELLYLKCERMFVDGTSFYFQEFNGASWRDKISSELGILEMYFELDTTTNILDMYVLASGGINDSKTTQKPSAWPGTWKSEYANYIVYMSCASWKLKNLPDAFNWN